MNCMLQFFLNYDRNKRIIHLCLSFGNGFGYSFNECIFISQPNDEIRIGFLIQISNCYAGPNLISKIIELKKK